MLDSSVDPNLDEALLLISAHIHRRSIAWVTENLERIDQLAFDLNAHNATEIAAFLFGGDGPFRGNREDYYDPRNSFLDHVLISRRGIPITLSVLLIEVARRVGVTLRPVGMPGHFLVGEDVPVGRVPETFFDPYNGPGVLDGDGCRELFRRIAGAQPFDRRFLAAVHPTSVIERGLGNLKMIFQSSGDLESLRSVMSLRAAIPGLARAERDEFLRLMAPLN